MTNIKAFKPVIKQLISFYYNEAGYSTGGPILHYMLDDGNISIQGINNDMFACLERGDHLGALICEVLLQFTQEEIEDMYNDNHWGLRSETK